MRKIITIMFIILAITPIFLYDFVIVGGRPIGVYIGNGIVEKWNGDYTNVTAAAVYSGDSKYTVIGLTNHGVTTVQRGVLPTPLASACYYNDAFNATACWSPDGGWMIMPLITIFYSSNRATFEYGSVGVMLVTTSSDPVVAEPYWTNNIVKVFKKAYVVTGEDQTWMVSPSGTVYHVYGFLNGVWMVMHETLLSTVSITPTYQLDQPVTVVVGNSLIDDGTIITIPTEYSIVAYNIMLVKYMSLHSRSLHFTKTPMTSLVRELNYGGVGHVSSMLPWEFLQTKTGVCGDFALLYAAYFMTTRFTLIVIDFDNLPYGHVAVEMNGKIYENQNPGEYGFSSMISWLGEYARGAEFYFIVFDNGRVVTITSTHIKFKK